MEERPRVVVGVDGSAGSCAAVLFALEEAAQRGTGVRVVSALLSPQYRPDAYGLSAPPSPVRASATAASDRSTDRSEERF